MTTIATDGHIIAADSAMNWNGIKQGPFVKLHYADDAIVGCAGEYEAMLEFVNWYRGGADARPSLPDDAEALVLTREGIRFYGNRCTGFAVQPPIAIGSGSAIAIAAMLAGADPIRAVEIACALDPGTAGPIQHTTISANPDDLLRLQEAMKWQTNP